MARCRLNCWSCGTVLIGRGRRNCCRGHSRQSGFRGSSAPRSWRRKRRRSPWASWGRPPSSSTARTHSPPKGPCLASPAGFTPRLRGQPVCLTWISSSTRWSDIARRGPRGRCLAHRARRLLYEARGPIAGPRASAAEPRLPLDLHKTWWCPGRIRTCDTRFGRPTWPKVYLEFRWAATALAGWYAVWLWVLSDLWVPLRYPECAARGEVPSVVWMLWLRSDRTSSHQPGPPGPPPLPPTMCWARQSGSSSPNSIRPHRRHVDLTV